MKLEKPPQLPDTISNQDRSTDLQGRMFRNEAPPEPLRLPRFLKLLVLLCLALSAVVWWWLLRDLP